MTPDKSSPSPSPSPTRYLRITCLCLIALLYVASVPWYREAGAEPRLWLGLPDWVAVAVLCYVAVAVLNAVAWLATDVPDGPMQAVRADRAESDPGTHR